MTIRQRKGRLDHLTIGFCGDLKFGRTVHSLTAALSQFEGTGSCSSRRKICACRSM